MCLAEECDCLLHTIERCKDHNFRVIGIAYFTALFLSHFVTHSQSIIAMSYDEEKKMPPMGRSLVDDASTVNFTSDGETFASEADQLSLQPESNLLALDEASEHSRLLTDDDDSASDGMWVKATGNLRSLEDGNSSVNTTSTYERTLFSATEDEELILKHERSWKVHDGALAQSQSADEGYACETLWETQAMLYHVRTSIEESIKNGWQEGTNSKQQVENGIADSSFACLQASVSVCNDQLEALLIRFFNAPTNAVETRPSYVVSLDESLTDDLKSFSDALVAQRTHTERTEHDILIEPVKQSSKAESFPGTESETTADQSLQYSYSDTRDDILDEVLSDDFDPQEAILRLSEERASSIVGSSETEDSDSRFKEGPDEDHLFEDNIAYDDDKQPSKVDIVAESRNDETVRLVPVEHKEEIGSSSSEDEYGVQTSEFATMIEETAKDSGELLQKDENEVDTSFSAMHRKRVVDLINRNLRSTNRVDVIDLSSFGNDFMDTKSAVRDFHMASSTLFSAGDPERRQKENQIEEIVRRREKYRSAMKRLNLPVFQPQETRGAAYLHASDASAEFEELQVSNCEIPTVPSSAQKSFGMQTPIDLTMYEDFL